MACHPPKSAARFMQTPMETGRDLPRLWLFTDPRIDDRLERAIRRLPPGSGIIFRHYHLDAAARHALFRQVRRWARARGHKVLLAGSAALARQWGADGWHGPAQKRVNPPRRGLHSMPVHDQRELNMARRGGADLIFLSPVYPTRSHPGGAVLGPARFRALAALAPMPVMALGGMNAARFAMMRRLYETRIIAGWAAIDALAR